MLTWLLSLKVILIAIIIDYYSYIKLGIFEISFIINHITNKILNINIKILLFNLYQMIIYKILKFLKL